MPQKKYVNVLSKINVIQVFEKTEGFFIIYIDLSQNKRQQSDSKIKKDRYINRTMKFSFLIFFDKDKVN